MSQKPDEKKTEPAKVAAPSQAQTNPSAFIIQLKKFLAIISKISNAIFKNPIVVGTISFVKKLGVEGWLKILTSITLIALAFVIYKTAPHWNKFWRLPYIASFNDVADKKITYDNNVQVIRYGNDLLAPQFVVLISKIVVNIRPGKKSTDNPMVAFDLFVRTDTEEASIEVRKREKELQDHLQRFCETLNYDQILTEEGKQIWKQKMKRELNLVLNTGQVKDVYFKTLLLKP